MDHFTLWISRDRSGFICLWLKKPIKNEGAGWFYTEARLLDIVGDLPQSAFPELTFENSPREVELKLIEK